MVEKEISSPQCRMVTQFLKDYHGTVLSNEGMRLSKDLMSLARESSSRKLLSKTLEFINYFNLNSEQADKAVRSIRTMNMLILRELNGKNSDSERAIVPIIDAISMREKGQRNADDAVYSLVYVGSAFLISYKSNMDKQQSVEMLQSVGKIFSKFVYSGRDYIEEILNFSLELAERAATSSCPEHMLSFIKRAERKFDAQPMLRKIPSTDEYGTSVHYCMSVQKGDASPRIEVELDGKRLEFREVQGMYMDELSKCKVTICGISINFKQVGKRNYRAFANAFDINSNSTYIYNKTATYVLKDLYKNSNAAIMPRI